jgi:small ligand-binding sensory domain FIST
MPFASALATVADTNQAMADACAQAAEQLGGAPDLAFVFFSPHHAGNAEALVTAGRRLGARCLLGCAGEAVVGNDQEVEGAPALCVWLARWPRPVSLRSFQLDLHETPEGQSLLGWPDEISDADPAGSALLVLGDPFSFPADACLQQVNEAYPGLRVVGGMSSGGAGPDECRLFLDDRVETQGAVGVLLQGPIGLRSIVSQGCRPIGRHMVVTRARDNVIAELSGRPPVAQLRDLWQDLNSEERTLLQHGLHVGRVINEYQGEFQRGDFLVRNVLGMDEGSGALAINDRVRVGQTVQFQVRDAQTADEDLRALLRLDRNAHEAAPAGALLFTCNGRGTRLFRQPHHDARLIRAEVGALPLAGFFAQGELGPVGGLNFIHGFTASVALFEE